MPTHLKRCPNCNTYTIEESICKNCGKQLENVEPARFSLQDKYQKYRLPYFREKMNSKFPDIKKN